VIYAVRPAPWACSFSPAVFGLLSYPIDETNSRKYDFKVSNTLAGIELHQINNEIMCMKSLIGLYQAIQDDNMLKIEELLPEAFRNPMFQNRNEHYEIDDIIEIESATNLFDSIINTVLADISPVLFTETGGSMGWNYTSLLSAIYLMFSLDITTKKPPKICANKLCRRIFTPTKETGIYCSGACQHRARQRRYKQKKKKEELDGKR